MIAFLEKSVKDTKTGLPLPYAYYLQMGIANYDNCKGFSGDNLVGVFS
jgi:hypothetical protein